MAVAALAPVTGIPPASVTAGATAPSNGSGGFGAALSALNSIENGAAQAATAVATGQSQDIVTAVADAEKAALALQLAAQVRDIALQAYQSISQAP